jgi:sarcosine oxidase
MSTDYDIIVIGLGVMGAAALAEVAARGVRVLGLERFDIPHALGSSHGGTRVIRKAYYEDPRYVPLLHASWDGWQDLSAEVGEALLIPTGGLHFGPRESPELRAVLAAAEAHGLAHQVLDAAQIHRRFETFHPAPDDWGVLEADAGVLFAERAVMALVEVARRRGAEVRAREEVLDLELGGERVIVTTDRAHYTAAKVVLALGPWWPRWAARLEPGPAATVPMTVTRQVQCWFATRDPAAFRPDRFPIFLRYGLGARATSDRLPQDGDDDMVYGLPEAAFPGLKVALHAVATGQVETDAPRVERVSDPDQVDRRLRPEDEARVRRFVSRFLPLADGPLLGARVCMYTSSLDGHFALGPHPADPRLIALSGFSGHGFKLAPAVGAIAADYAIDGTSPRTIDLFHWDAPR